MAARWEKQFDTAKASAALNGELPALDITEVVNHAGNQARSVNRARSA